jgi:MFS family permease
VRDNATLRFDLGLARVSLILFLVGCISIPFAPSGLAFIGISTFNSLGGGFNPAVHAIALELFARQPRRSAAQAGTLFGAIAVLTSIVADVLGPALYGSVYVAAVGVFLPAIWFLSALFVGVGFVLLMLVRIPKNDKVDDEAAQTA